ncbi:MAG TPA: SDR family NAD(P)-dependent oxidoreductase, partial [Pirellulaceae bacterium]|nr:SDR family NAD(P)-dependent oxidoreductase [Pirellulaceae bacterium]
ALLDQHLPQPLLSVLFGSEDPLSPLHQTLFTQPALFAVEYALCELWKSWGIRADLALGHSIGEYVAACELGVFGLEDALRLVAARGRLMQQLPLTGAMVAVAADDRRVRALLESNGHIEVAAVNSPQQTVLSGPEAAIDHAASILEAAGLRTSRLRVSHAFHSSLMEPMLDEFESLCREVPFQQPRAAIASNVHGRLVTDEIASPQYWREQIRSTVRFADGLEALEQGGIDIYLEIGPRPVLTPAGRQTLTDYGQLWLTSLRPGTDDWLQMLECAAELYVRGLPLDWEGFYRDHPRRKVVLPNYPFQRSRYWIDSPDRSKSRGDSTSDQSALPASQESLDDCLFEVQWQPRMRLDQDLPRRSADFIPAADVLRQAVRPEIERLQAQLTLPRYMELSASLERLSARFVLQALAQLGWSPAAGEEFSTAGLAERLGVASRQRLLGRLLDMLAEDGLLARTPIGWQLGTAPAASDPAAEIAALLRRYPECHAELTLLASCAGNLAGVLRGEIDPLQLLFPQGSTAAVEALYEDSPFARSLNALLEETLSRAIADLPVGRPLRILEIGAGTGGTTSHLLPRLPAERTEYVFTDVSQVFLHEARSKFRQFPFLQYAVLDIESDPQAQGFAPGQFDLVIASNVLHATRNLRQSLAHVRQLLAPEGALLLLEGTRPERWLDLIFGLTEGWWRFADDEFRPKHPLATAETWRHVLAQQGFADFAALPQTGVGQTEAPQAVIFARLGTVSPPAAETSPEPESSRDETPVSKWLILADRHGVGSALAAALEAAGHECALLPADRSRDLCGLLESHNFAGIVHLWGLDTASADELSVDRLQEAQWLACESAIEVCQELVSQASEAPPRLWLVTRGAQAVATGDQLPGLAQSPLWGLGRAVAEEQPTLFGGLVDLDPVLEPHEAALLLAAELQKPDGENQVAYREHGRYAARLVRRPPESGSHQPLRWRTDGSYLVTGGLGEIGLQVAAWMVDQGAHHLILTDRTARESERVRRLEERGVTIRVAAVDVTDEAAMRDLLHSLAAEGWPPIRGVVHAADVADAQPLAAIRSERLMEVVGSKLIGGWLLHKLLRGERLDFFVCCALADALLPTPEHVLPAAAGEFPGALAHYRRAQGLPALTVNFATPEGLSALEHLLERGATQTAITPLDLTASQSSLLANLRLMELEPEAPMAAQGSSGVSPRAAMVSAAPQKRRELVESYLRDQISRVLRADPARLDAHQSLGSLGIDSLMAVELRNQVQAHLEVTIPLARLMQDPTIYQLAQTVLDQWGVAPPPTSAAASSPADRPVDSPDPPAKPRQVPAPATLDQVQDLSDEEVDALLRQMLNEEQTQA